MKYTVIKNFNQIVKQYINFILTSMLRIKSLPLGSLYKIY